MPILYVNNYRGFEKTFMKLDKVNFFVGENSTGKTSILKLIKAISSTRFWFNSEFNTEEAELGYFNEIITKGSNLKSFQIGLLNDSNKDELIAIKLNIIEKDSQPFIDNVRIVNNLIDMEVKRIGKSIKYRFRKNNVSINEKNNIDYFSKWISTNYLKNKSYVAPKKDTLFLVEDSSIFIQTMFIMSQESKKGIRFVNPAEYINFLNDLTWGAPIRTEPKRTYDSYKTAYNPDGTHTPYLLKNLLTKKKGSSSRSRAEKILEKFGADSGLFNQIKINPLGNSNTSPFEIQIFLNDQPLKITNVGYGVSQVLPLIVDVISSSPNSWFAIQQPEIHLHPKAQAAFGDFLFKSSIEDDMNFIIETHSDFTIDRFRLKLSELESNNLFSQVVFFKRNKNGNQLHCINIESNGKYDKEMPSDFKDFFIREQINLLSI